MANITYDHQSFSIDGRRIWLVSAAIHYPRTPHQLWRKRIRAAKQAGCNCIETYVFWNVHETEPGVFDFAGDRDLRAFIKIVGEEGMFCYLRPGPYICAEWDFGGLPAWLNNIEDIDFRTANGPFLEASARYIGAVMEQVRDLQITSKPATDTKWPKQVSQSRQSGYRGEGGGPIVLMQTENEWFCTSDELHDSYLLENVRHLRENGCTVPITNCNKLWQRVDGTIDTWNDKQHLPATMRQLATLQPDAPRIVTEFWPGWFDLWGKPHNTEDKPDDVLHRLAGILSAGSMYNIYMFHGGTHSGFSSGRLTEHPGTYFPTSYDYDAPLLEAGGRAEKYDAVKRVSMFASHFGEVFANLSNTPMHTTIAPDADDHPPAVTQLSGSRGDVIFILRGKKDKTKQLDLLLPQGQTLPVQLGSDRAAWLLLNAKLSDELLIDYTNLRPFAYLNAKILVLFGPAGTDGLISINGAPLIVSVPNGKQPHVQQVDGLTLVVLNEDQADAAYVLADGLVVGAAGLDDEDNPIPRNGWATCYQIDLAGKVGKQSQKTERKPAAPKLTDWQHATLGTLLDGSDPSYQPIDGPASLESLGQYNSYGWYRVPVTKTNSGKLLWPDTDDRLHLYDNGKLLTIIGAGDDADDQPTGIKLNDTLTVLADNMGRFHYGHKMGEPKGIAGHLYKVSAVKLAKPKITRQPAPDPFKFIGTAFGKQQGHRPPAQALTWTVTPDGRKPLILETGMNLPDCVIMMNGEPVGLHFKSDKPSGDRFVLEPGVGPVKGGKNQLELALYEPLPDGVDPLKSIKLYKVTDIVSDKRGQWSFSKWAPPADDAFEDLPKSTPSQPAWFRATFNVKQNDVPLWLEPVGMSKGQVFLNGHNVGRYWVATRTGKKVPPQEAYYLPEPWLNVDSENELLIFDEHGKLPNKCKLVYNENGPYG